MRQLAQIDEFGNILDNSVILPTPLKVDKPDKPCERCKKPTPRQNGRYRDEGWYCTICVHIPTEPPKTDIQNNLDGLRHLVEMLRSGETDNGAETLIPVKMIRILQIAIKRARAANDHKWANAVQIILNDQESLYRDKLA